MKILLYNVGYFTGNDGSVADYLTGSYRYFWKKGHYQIETAEKIRCLIAEHEPDICGLIEIEAATPASPAYLCASDHLPHLSCAVKYGHDSLLRKIGFFKNNGNAVLSRKELTVKQHYLQNGNKRLVLEIEVTDRFSIFVVHLSLRRNTREKQFYELKTIIRGKKQVIVCGDFNIFGGREELEPLLNKTNLRIVNKHGDLTFPANNPRLMLDVFLCSHNLKVKDLQVLACDSSDHLPVLLEIDRESLV